jgi:hypothetical protein
MDTFKLLTLIFFLLFLVMTIAYFTRPYNMPPDVISKEDYDKLHDQFMSLLKDNDRLTVCCNNSNDLLTQRNSLLNEKDVLTLNLQTCTDRVSSLLTQQTS